VKIKTIIWTITLIVLLPTVALAKYEENPLKVLIGMYGEYDSCARHYYNYGNGVKTWVKEYLWKDGHVYLMIVKSPSLWKGWRIVSYLNLIENKGVIKPNA
jgi:hypothetical protein